MSSSSHGSPDPSPAPQRIELRRLDCEVLALLASARLDDPAMEERRCALLDAALHAGHAAARRLDEFTRHAVTECHGSRSKWNVSGDARVFFDTFAEYAALVRWTAEQLCQLSEADASWRPPEGRPRGGLRVLRGAE